MEYLTPLQYTKVAVANSAGLDKESWATRIHWVDKFNHKLETKQNAESPALYAKAVRALRDAENGVPTGFIMSLDATASGYQIMGALTRCEKTMQNTNVLDTGERKDLYTYIKDKMSTVAKMDMERAIVKKCIMTTGYGSKRKPIELFGEDTPELFAYYQIMDFELEGAMSMLNFVQSCWNPYALQYKWTLPDGHVVVMKVMDTVDKKIEVDELDHATYTYRASVNMPLQFSASLTANLVHSVDGWIVREMVRRGNKAGIRIATIHDSFWAHPNDMQFVRQTYANLLAEIAESNMLSDMLTELTGSKVRLTYAASNFGPAIRKSNYALS